MTCEQIADVLDTLYWVAAQGFNPALALMIRILERALAACS